MLLEESIQGWKEYELELMRDRNDNVVVICSIENIDPMGVHTGDSITVAPAMTLTDREYQNLRDISIDVIRAVGVDTGGCNIQFAVQPQTDPAVYKPMLDFIWDIFGEDYVVFAAGWSRMPVKPSPIERMRTNIEIMRAYFMAKGRPAAEKFFWKNSVPAFRWVRRDPRQPATA